MTSAPPLPLSNARGHGLWFPKRDCEKTAPTIGWTGTGRGNLSRGPRLRRPDPSCDDPSRFLTCLPTEPRCTPNKGATCSRRKDSVKVYQSSLGVKRRTRRTSLLTSSVTLDTLREHTSYGSFVTCANSCFVTEVKVKGLSVPTECTFLRVVMTTWEKTRVS